MSDGRFQLQDAPARFEAFVMPEPNSGCWIWLGAVQKNGYGHFWIDGRTVRAHRHAYIEKYGPIPDDLVLDHKCRVRCCVNPDHLELVTTKENIRRGDTGKAQKLKTHCPKGHAYDEKNTRICALGKRICRACDREAHRFRYRLAL
jgi:hypothetical protein